MLFYYKLVASYLFNHLCSRCFSYKWKREPYSNMLILIYTAIHTKIYVLNHSGLIRDVHLCSKYHSTLILVSKCQYSPVQVFCYSELSLTTCTPTEVESSLCFLLSLHNHASCPCPFSLLLSQHLM